MTLDEIKAAVDAGQTVYWANTGYVVHKDRLGQYLITYLPNGSCIGLTDREGQRLNGKEAEFFIAQSYDAAENPGRKVRIGTPCNGPKTKGELQCVNKLNLPSLSATALSATRQLNSKSASSNWPASCAAGAL